MKKLLILMLLSFAARGSTFSTDISDMWWNPNENGWGLNVTQQNEVLFLTMFVYNSAGQPLWFVGPQTSNNSSSGFVFTGPLYQVTGSYHGGSFNPVATNARQVGTITFNLTAISAATLTYVADGVSVTKSLTRQTWRTNDLSGSYMGGTAGTYSGPCPVSGYREEAGIATVSHSGSALTMTLTNSTGSCTYSGTYTQNGRMGAVSGTVSCTGGGGSGTFNAFEIEGGISVFSLRATAAFGACSWSGRVGGLRRGT